MLGNYGPVLAAETGHGGGGDGGGIGEVIMEHLEDSHELWGIVLPHLNIAGLDLPVTKMVVMMWVAALGLIALVQFGYRPGRVPTGIGNCLEIMIIFVRDDIVKINFGEQGKKYVPFFLTLFFFILFMNLLGMVPYMTTATGAINVTGALAVVTLFMIHAAGIRTHGFFQHWKNQMPAGVPLWLFPIMLPVEIIGMFTKPFALMVRLFANMTAGHVVILALIGIIIQAGTWFASPIILFSVAISMLELFIAFLQAFIFTFLSAIFISSTVHGAH